MDALAIQLYLCRVEERLLTYAAEARRLREDSDALGFVDEGMAIHRAQMLEGLGEFRRDDMRVLLPRTRVGRAMVWAARMLGRMGRAVG